MSRRLMVGCLILGMAVLIAGFPHAVTAAPSDLPDQARVVVAEDQTAASDCQTWGDTPQHAVACDPGTVIVARTTTYAEVKQAGITEYARLTGDPQQDRAVQDRLVGSVHDRVRPKRSQPFACTVGWKEINGSYLSIPSNATSARIFYSVRYWVAADCRALEIKDLSRISAGQLQWLQSCSNGAANCSGRGFNMTVNWSAPQAMFDSRVGAEYRHLAAAPCWNCGMPYGIHHFAP